MNTLEREVEVKTALEEAEFKYKRLSVLADVFSSYSVVAEIESSGGFLNWERDNEEGEYVYQFFDDLDDFYIHMFNELQNLSTDTSKWVGKLERAIELLKENREERALKEEGIIL